MTIDEAIRILKLSIRDSRKHIRFCYDEKGITALDMAIQALEQESSVSENPNNCEMRDATLEERESIDKYIKSISKPTGVKFGALEQEPCEDAVSRDAALKPYNDLNDEDTISVWLVRENIKELPSVKPQACEGCDYKEWLKGEVKPQTGHWIYMGDRYIKCSECGHITKTESPDIYHFCMVCGANMSEIPTSSKPEISSYYGLKSYVRERSE